MWTDLLIRLKAVFQRRAVESELDDELKFHIEQQTEKYIKAGYTRQDAERQARLDLGGPEQIKEECRQSRGVQLFDELCGDVRYALRQLRRTPVFTFVAVLTLAIGIGTNTAIFSLLDAVMLRRLPVSHPEQLRQLSWTSDRDGFAPSYRGGGVSINASGSRGRDAFAYPVCEYLNGHTNSFSDVFCWTFEDMTLSTAGRMETVRVQRVSGNYFAGLALSPLMGRILGPEDSQPGASPVAVISYGFWQRDRAGEPDVVGQAIVLDGASVPIVGIMPREFLGINPAARTDIVLPVPYDDGALRDARTWRFQIFARLKPDVTDEQARAETEIQVRQAILNAPQDRPYNLPRLWLTDGSHGLQGLQRSVSTPLFILASGASLILIIACSNLAGMLLSRSAARQREVATRLSLGGRRARVVRQLLSESIVLSMLGGGAGAIFLYLLPAWLLAGLRRGYQNSGVDLSPNPSVFFVAFALSVLTAIAFGLAPALRTTQMNLVSVMKRRENSSSGHNHFAGKVLVSVQVALSLVLLVACGLFIRTVVNLQSMPKGFRADGLLTFQVNPARAGYQRSRVIDFYQDLTNRLESLPGVSSVSFSMNGILTDSESGANVRLPGTRDERQDENIRLQSIGPRFFETMATPLLLGRDFRWQDRTAPVIPVIVNEALAKRLFPGKIAVGENVVLDVFGGPNAEIIGVVADTKYNDLRAGPPPTAYVSIMHYNVGSMIFVLRSELETAALSAGIRQTIHDLDPSLPVDQVMTQQAYIDRKMSREQMISTMLTGFGAVALFLAALGIYGTLACSVSRRTSEIGIRMALGARRWSVIRSVVHQSLLPVIAGILLGLCGTAALKGLFTGLLFEITPGDPGIVLGAVTILMLTAIAAACIPARRASRIDPMTALRHE